MGKKLRNLVAGVMGLAATLMPMKANAQSLSQKFMDSKPITEDAPALVIPTITKNGSTPIEVFGNPYNPWVVVDDTNTFNSYKDWISKTTREERIAYINQIVKGDSLDTKIDSLRQNEGWICGDIVNEMQLRIGQIVNEDEFVATQHPSGGSFFKGNHKIRIPVYQVATQGVEVAHFVNGALVGDSTGNMDPTNFNAWYFWSNYFAWDRMDIKPGDPEMEDGPVSIGLTTYQKSVIDNKNFFSYIDGIVQWDLKNGVATLKYQKPYLVKEDPNKIKVNVEKNLENIVVDSKKAKDLSPQNLESWGYNSIPNVSNENTTLAPNLSYFDSDTTWSADSSNYSFNREFYGWNYEGGITKVDSSAQKVTLDNPTPIEGVENNLPYKFEVYQNYPNPFNPSTTIEYKNNKYGNVKLNVYDVLGRKLESRIQEGDFPGKHKFNINMNKYSSGVYLFEVEEGKNHKIIKSLLQK